MCADEGRNEPLEISHADLPQAGSRLLADAIGLSGLLRFDEQRLAALGRLAIACVVEGMADEVGPTAGCRGAPLDRHKAGSGQQALQLMEVVEPVMALAHGCQTHVLLAKGLGQQLQHSPDPEALDLGGNPLGHLAQTTNAGGGRSIPLQRGGERRPRPQRCDWGLIVAAGSNVPAHRPLPGERIDPAGPALKNLPVDTHRNRHGLGKCGKDSLDLAPPISTRHQA